MKLHSTFLNLIYNVNNMFNTLGITKGISPKAYA